VSNAASLENFRSISALARFFVTAAVGLFLDLWTKHLAFTKLASYDANGNLIANKVYDFIPTWLHFTVTTNPGAVFGLGAGRRALFLTVSLAAIGFLSYLVATSGRQRFYQFVLGMLLAGVLGNMYDRIVYGHVRDMIHGLPQRTWPGTNMEIFPWIFNVADVLLCTGVGLMVIYHFIQARYEAKRETQGVPVETPAP
jgi:lipoprotein signal peptidase